MKDATIFFNQMQFHVAQFWDQLIVLFVCVDTLHPVSIIPVMSGRFPFVLGSVSTKLRIQCLAQ